MSIFVRAWPNTPSGITFREAATILISSQKGGNESSSVYKGGYRVSVGHPACLGRNRVCVDVKDSEHQHLIVVGFANQVQFPKM